MKCCVLPQAGCAALMPESMAIFAPSLNSYRRFAPDMFAPVNRRWGVNNRSAGLRVPVGPNDARRIEHRVAGADANPYLVLAAVLAGVHHGIVNKIDPGPPAVGNVSREPDRALPFTLDDALELLEDAKVLAGLFWRRNACALSRDQAHRTAAPAQAHHRCGIRVVFVTPSPASW